MSVTHFEFEGLALSWRDRHTFGYVEPEKYIVAVKSWRLFVFGIRMWRVTEDLFEVSVNQYFSRAPFGDRVLDAEQLETAMSMQTPLTIAARHRNE